MTTKDTFFTPEFKLDALDRIANWELRQHEKPAWTGVFWPGTPPAEQPYNAFHHDGRLTISLNATLRRKDFEAAICRFPESKAAIESLQKALSEANVAFDEDDLSLFEHAVGGQISRYEFHKHMLELVAEPEDTIVFRIAFVAERLELAAQAALTGLLFKIDKSVRPNFFKVICSEGGSYTFNSLDTINDLDGAFHRRRSDNGEFDAYWRRRENARAPQKINIFNNPKFGEFISGEVLYITRATGGHSRLAVILTDMAAQGIKQVQLIDHKGQSHTLVDLDQLTTLKKARARIHELCGWNPFAAIRELPSPQTVHRFIVVNRQVIADTPLLNADTVGSMSEMSYVCANGRTSTATRSVPKQTVKDTVLDWVNKIIDALHPAQTSVLIDVGLSATGPNLVAVHDILEEDWFTADRSLIIGKLAEQQDRLYDHRGFRRVPDRPSVLAALRVLDNVDLQPDT
ncbi:hypothetical protein [Rhizobium sp. MHM7A]|uniref:hypothetical protein n=1 Tax=Rhizobium sp. MHM7A TaxID=2583233 RepID=UPI0011068A9B|nr:hypothetical protein [Rhizobium sp. MHM7A]TLX15915.1 hypothetical protein FFR93_00955 [Rhizobium sp. MHM7A]